jgi:hypothetical protein
MTVESPEVPAAGPGKARRWLQKEDGKWPARVLYAGGAAAAALVVLVVVVAASAAVAVKNKQPSGLQHPRSAARTPSFRHHIQGAPVPAIGRSPVYSARRAVPPTL